MNTPEWLKPGIYGALIGAVFVGVVGFTWGGWVTGGSANVHYSRFGGLERPDYLITSPAVPLDSYWDGYALLADKLRQKIARPAVLSFLTRLGGGTLAAMGIATATIRHS